MDVTTINPILEAFANILPQIGFASVNKKEVRVEGSDITNPGVMINIGVLGPLRGNIIIAMSLAEAKRFASVMMMGMEVAEFDALAQSAISEMGNMVCANACTNFAGAGIQGLDISPPTLLVGAGGQVKIAVKQAIVITFDVDGIIVDVHVGLFR